MADSINTKAKEYYDNDSSGGSFNSNLKQFLKDQKVEGTSLNTMWRNYANNNGGESLNTRLSNLWGTSGSLISRWHKHLGATWDDLKLFFDFRNIREEISHASTGSCSFDGTDDYIDTGVAFSNTVHTISGWFKLDNVSGNRTLFCGRDGNDDGIRVLLNTSQILYQVNVSDEASGTGSISANVWTHVACTYDGTTQSIYLNGSLSASQSISRTINTTETAKIGRTGYGGSDYMLGSLANIGLWNRALSASEVQGIMYKQYSELGSVDKASLVSWWSLSDESLGDELVTNGDFPSGLSDGDDGYDNGDGTVDGWSGISNDVLSLDSSTKDGSANSLKIVNSVGWLTASYNLGTLTDGKAYRVSYDISVLSGGANRRVGISNNTSSGSAEYLSGASATPTDGGGWESGSFTFQKSGTETSYFKVMGYTATIYIDNIVVKELTLDDSHSTNHGSPVGATTNSTIYGDNAPQTPRILDVAQDSVKNFGTLKSGTALSFDGTNDYVDIDSAISAISSDTVGTLSAWVNFDDLATDWDTLFGFTDGGASGTNRFLVRVNDTNNEFNVHFASGGTTQWKFDTDNTYNTGQWYFLQLVQDGTEPKLYIDGTEQAITYTTTTDKTQWFDDLSSFSEARIGCEDIGGNTRFIDGKISNVKIFNSVLTESEIQEMYLNPEQILPTGVSSSNLKLYLPMNEGDGDYNYDGSGNQNHGTITGATWATGESGHLPMTALVRQNSPMVFDGSDDVVACGDGTSLDMTTAYTLSGWVYLDSITGATQFLFGRDDGSNRNYWIELSGTATVSSVNFGTSQVSTTTTTTLTAGVWSHICATYDGSNVKIYLNGALDTSASATGTLDNDDVSFSIGAREAGLDRFFGGLINEVAIWDEALDADAVTALYNSGTPLDATTDSGNYDNSGDLQGYWRNDNDTTWTDRSTNSNDGTVAGSPDSIVLTEGLTSGRDSQGFFLTDTTENCLTLNGAEYVETDSILTTIGTDTSGTVEMWVRPVDSTPSAHLKVFSIDDTDANTQFFLQLRTDGIFRAMVKNAGTNQWYIETDSAELSSGTWHHIVLSQDGTEPVLYIDGDVPSQTFPVTTDKTAWLNDLSGVDNVIIGASNVNSNGYANFFDGDIDDFRYYSNKALSASEVTKNYNAGKSKH